MKTLDELRVELNKHSKQITEILDLYSLSLAPRIYRYYMSIILTKWDDFAENETEMLKSKYSTNEFQTLLEQSTLRLFEQAGEQLSDRRVSKQVGKVFFNSNLDYVKKNEKEPKRGLSKHIFEQLSILNTAAMDNYVDPLGIGYAKVLGSVNEDVFKAFEVIDDDQNSLFSRYLTALEMSESINSIKTHLIKGTDKKALELNLRKANPSKLSDTDKENILKEYNKILSNPKPKHLKGNKNLNLSHISKDIKDTLRLEVSNRTIQRHLVKNF